MKTLLLIDANSFIHRAFHALPPLTAPDGRPSGALFGLANTLAKIISDLKPGYIAAAFDRKEPTFREKIFKEYKANRPPIPDELISQIIEAQNLFKVLNIPIFDKAGYEADDILGTLAAKLKDKNLRIVILSGDLDSLQLVEDEKVLVYVPKKGVSEIQIYGEHEVEEKLGVPPSKVSDYKGLVGDPSDNVPGVPGVGPKTAALLLKESSSLEEMYAAMKEDHPFAKKVLPYKDKAMLSKRLTSIKQDVPLKISLEKLRYNPPTKNQLIAYFKKLGFESLIRRLEAGEEKQKGPTPKTLAPDKNFLVFEDANYAKKHKSELRSSKMKIAYDWKEIVKSLRDPDAASPPIFDLKIGAWLTDPDTKDLSLNSLSKKFLKKELGDKNEALLNLYKALRALLVKYDLVSVFESIELPLIPVLADIELCGIKVDKITLERLEAELQKELIRLEKEIYNLAGVSFNLNSPKQVSEVLFERMGVGSAKTKHTKTGQKSTREDVLLELKNAHPIVQKILEYRESSKVLNTYVLPLKDLAVKGTIHTTFLQTGTATGRLSSQAPNLQNIPTDSRWAPLLRSAFLAREGMTLVSLDYSQLELRLLAHLSQDGQLVSAFGENKDIHRLTAAKIFKVNFDSVTPQMRKLGKTLNFGIVYGMGFRSFAKTSGVPLNEAKLFIENYFKNFPGIKIWQEKTKSEAKTFGFIKNENGRRRFFHKALSMHPAVVSEVERMAVNMPVQSLGADILKTGMIKARELIRSRGWSNAVRLLLSIHDELLYEISDDMLEEITPLLSKELERAYPLSVPLAVEAKQGKSWGTMT